MAINAQGQFEKLRKEILKEFLSRHFLFGGLVSSDTYKRTMWEALREFADAWAAYHLTLRKGLNEPGADNQLIMAGHEWILSQWFYKPLQRSKIELMIEWYTKHSNVKAFPTEIFEQILKDQPGKNIYLPIDVWGFPGGQTFLAGVPSISLEGVGGLVSFLEPHKCRYSIPIIQATKARLMFEAAGPTHAEFGYRSDVNELASLAKMFAMYIGNGDNPILTSCDIAEFLFPELYKSVGTVGHEAMEVAQSFDKPLDVAEYEIMDLLADRMSNVMLLTDLVDPLTVGLKNSIAVMRKYSAKKDIGVRFDSGCIEDQTVLYYNRQAEDPLVGARRNVYEDGVTPTKVYEVSDYFEQNTDASSRQYLIPGSGGYYTKAHRDDVSAGFKRSMTGENPNMKFGGSPGKGSEPGCIRVYGRGDTMIKAHVTERIDGEPLYVKLVDQGRYCYREHMHLREQAQRANKTWDKYKKVERSPLLQEWHEKFTQMRREAQERASNSL